MKKRILTLGIVFALLVALIIPTAALAAVESATVDGESVAAYTINTAIDFGQVVVGSTTTETAVLVAGPTGTTAVAIAVAASSGTYTPDRLVSLDYKLGAVSKYLITAPAAASGPYILDPVAETEVVMAANESWDLTAIAGAAIGAWEQVAITLTVT